MELVVKAKHFKDTRFERLCFCALAKAAKEQFNTLDVDESVVEIRIGDNRYKHDMYCDQFDDDKEKAESLNYSDEVIRTIELTPIN